MNALSYRIINLITALGCGMALLFAVLYLQEHLGLKPCYLCVTQRFFVTATGLLFLLATIHNNFGLPRSIYASLSCMFAMGGAFFAMKQLWLQSLSEDQVPSCGPPVEYVFEAFSARAGFLKNVLPPARELNSQGPTLPKSDSKWCFFLRGLR